MKQGRIGMMKRKCWGLLLTAIVIVLTALALSSCSGGDDKLTMYVGLGSAGDGYYEKIKEAVKKETGIELEFVSSTTMDTSNSMVNKISNNDLPADIITTASKTKNEYCQNSLLDLAAYTNIPDQFKSTDIEALADDNGEVYQLPFATRLIGIGYNKTLLEEMGWELPKTFEDMVALKAKADAAGVRFAVFCTAATGHGFNNLFHLMGSDYLVKPDGVEWYNKFMSGETGVDEFADEARYFKRYAEAGLFGDVHEGDWEVIKEFSETRALFYYNIITNAESYEGFQYNEDGSLVSDEEIHDEYGIMPWISEDGNTNCFTEYNCLYIGLNKNLIENEKKLEAAITVLQFMLSDEATSIFSDYCKDGIVKTNSYEIGSDRLYYEYADAINKGFTQPWYYNDFDVDSIVYVGEKVNAYLSDDKSVTYSSIINELDYRNRENLKSHVAVLAEIKTTLDYEDDAKLQAIANALAAQDAMATSGKSGKVSVALLPYIETPNDINEIVQLPVVQEKLYEGNLETAKLNAYVNNMANDLAIVKMKGDEINQLVKNGFDASVDFGYEHVFKMMCVSKDGEEIVADKDYLIAIPWRVLGAEKFEKYKKSGKVIMKDGEPIKATTIDGLNLFFKDKKAISADDLIF